MDVRESLDFANAPARIRRLPIDPERGYPVPWFVDWLDGRPEFRAMDMRKYVRALREKLCWVCGEPLGVNVAFVAGPMCGINRTSSEPPSHLDCARWSAIHCPFLNNPEMVRREDDLINNSTLREASPGLAITRNPGVTMVWVTRSFEVYRSPSPGGDPRRYLITMGEPSSVSWYARGRPATRDEVLASIEAGMPALRAIAQQERGAVEELLKLRERFEQKYLPQ